MTSLRNSPQASKRPINKNESVKKIEPLSTSDKKNNPSGLPYVPDATSHSRLSMSPSKTYSLPQSPKAHFSEPPNKPKNQANDQPIFAIKKYQLVFSPGGAKKNPFEYHKKPEYKQNIESKSQLYHKNRSAKTVFSQKEIKNSLLAVFFPPLHSPTASSGNSKSQQHTTGLPASPNSKFRKFFADSKESVQYSCVIGLGNNSELIRRVMKKRYWWRELNESSSLYHFAWHQSSKRHNYENLVKMPNKITRIANHFEFHAEITTKSGLLRNLTAYCEQQNINVFDYIPITFMIDLDDKSLEFDLQEFTKCFYRFAPSPDDSMRAINTFTQLLRHSLNYRMILKASSFKSSSLLKNFKAQDTFYRGSNLWLLKPVDYNRGRGIELFNTLDGLKNLLLNGPIVNPVLNGPKIKRFVIQKYIESPLLIENRKFDIRVWVLIDQELNLYFFKEGYLRLSSEIFSIKEDTKNDLFVHLTNNAVQKTSTKYGQFESGNQLSFDDFERYLPEDNPKANLRKGILPKIKELIKLSMSSIKSKINSNDRKYCFEVFGYDFMIDSDFNTWLIEVNTNPCLEESSDLLKALIPRMIDDAFKLTIDKVFPLTPAMVKPEERTQSSEMYKVSGYQDKDNMWELLMNLSRQSFKK